MEKKELIKFLKWVNENFTEWGELYVCKMTGKDFSQEQVVAKYTPTNQPATK